MEPAANGGDREPGAADGGARAGFDLASPGRFALLWLGFGLLALAIYWPALRGPLLSDDYGYLTSPYTSALDMASLSRMFDPTGDARSYTGNYAPVHLLLHALERRLFDASLIGYHVVNVVVHALNAALLVLLLARRGAGPAAALLGGGWFAAHPAGVEAVAWVSQLKTNGALAFSLAALLAFERRPAVAATSFGLGLLTKASAAFALPTAAAWVWIRRGPVRDWMQIGVWCVLFAIYAFPQFSSFQQIGGVDVPEFEDPTVQLRTVAAIGARYLVMATTSIGVAAFQEPRPVTSWTDAWWLSGAILGVVLFWRVVRTLSAHSEEGGFWIAAAASFFPVSQIFPFLIPIADRYLYFILPGLIGGAILAGDAALRRITGDRRLAGRALASVAVVVICGFAVRSHERAGLWRNETLLHVDAARAYPDGGTAHFLRARRAAQEGDVEEAIASLRLAAERGVDRYASVRDDPAFASLRSEPEFQALVFELAGRFIEKANRGGVESQPWLMALARAHLERGETDQAIDALERAVARGGPLDDRARAELASLRAESPEVEP